MPKTSKMFERKSRGALVVQDDVGHLLDTLVSRDRNRWQGWFLRDRSVRGNKTLDAPRQKHLRIGLQQFWIAGELLSRKNSCDFANNSPAARSIPQQTKDRVAKSSLRTCAAIFRHSQPCTEVLLREYSAVRTYAVTDNERQGPFEAHGTTAKNFPVRRDTIFSDYWPSRRTWLRMYLMQSETSCFGSVPSSYSNAQRPSNKSPATT